MKGLAPDREVRSKSLDRRVSVILEAPAGSGKTSLLVARYLSLLAHVSHPRQIMAVTFTRKAAAEMATRIDNALRQAQEAPILHDEDAAAQSWDAELVQLARQALEANPEHWNIIQSPKGLLIDTFHGFCAAVVRGWPLEAGHPPGLTLLDELQQNEVLDEAMDRLLADGEAGLLDPVTQDALCSRLKAANGSAKVVGDQIRSLLKGRDLIQDLARAVQEEKRESSAIARRVEDLVADLLSPLARFFASPSWPWREIARAREEVGQSFPPSVPGLGLDDLLAWKDVADGFLTKNGNWRSRKIRKKLGKSAGYPLDFSNTSAARRIYEIPDEIRTELAFAAFLSELDRESPGSGLADTLLIFASAQKRLQMIQNRRGMDYLELEQGALRAFRSSPRPGESLIFFHEHLQHLLVDEAQDLNDTQAELLAALTAGWEPGDGRSLFVVGDPKQSIYRFRRAEVRLFVELQRLGLPREGEGPLPLQSLRLEANFRSRPHLVELANHLFPKVFPSPHPLFDDVEFAPSSATRNERQSLEKVQVAVFPTDKDSSKIEARRREARWVAARIARLYENHADQTVAILLPARTHLPIFHEEITAAKLPLRLLEGRPFLDCPEVRHLLNLFTALLRPFDDLAWAAAVRAPWFRVSLQELMELASSPEPLWPDKLASSPSTTAFWEPCARARERLGREPYGETLLGLWQELSGPRITAAMWDAQAVTNAHKLLTILDDLAPALGEEVLARVSRTLESSYAPPDPRAAASPISMMTIHQAKGLEFDHVVVVGLDKTHRQKGQTSPPVFLAEKLPDGSSLTTVGRDRRDLGAGMAWGLLQRLNDQRALAESRRLFYVAATRARESLALTGIYSKKKDPADEFRDESPISWTVRSLQDGALAGCSVELLDDPREEAEPVRAQLPLQIPAPADFDPVPLPYLVESPSRLAEETGLAIRSGEEETDVRARARGLIIHRLLETLARGRSLPGEKSVEAALAAEGLSPNESARHAKNALEEAQSAWDLPAFQALRQGAQLCPELSVEEALERDGESIVRIGRIDLLLKKPDDWIIIDYKTSQLPPDTSPLVERYRPQLRSYREMIAPTNGSSGPKTRAYLLLTAGPVLLEAG